MEMEYGKNTPFNIELLILDKNIERMLGRVSKTSIFKANSDTFEEGGLFSTEIFGQVGSEDRNNTFGYIRLGIKVFHPLIFDHISTLKAFYKDIILGTKYAKFDTTIKDFVPASYDEGKTGFSFFLTHLKDIKFESNNSDAREYKLRLLKLYKDEDSMLDKWLVLPAGLRDYVVSEDGKTSEDEVNDIYRKLITTTNLLNNINVTPSTEYTVDSIRVKIQLLVLELYMYFKDNILDGKDKFIQGKWAKRAIVNGTRNVLTPSISNITKLDQTDAISLEHTVCGLYQYVRAIAPVAMYKVHTKFINKIMNVSTNTVTLIDPKTLQSKLVDISIKKRDEWLTIEGLDEIFGKLSQEEVRGMPIIIEGYYMFLIYDNGKDIVVITSSNEITDDMDRSLIRPMTYYELLYISVNDVVNKYPGFVTRYPVANLGGIYPSKIYVKTTENARKCNVSYNGITEKMNEYPTIGNNYINSVAVHGTHIKALGADLKF